MDKLDDIVKAIQSLIVVGTALRVIICFVKIAVNGEEERVYKKRLVNSLVFLIISVCAVIISNLIIAYYS